MSRLATCAIVLALSLTAAADEAVQPILDLHKANKLFDKTEYKSVRAAAAKVFETRSATAIKDAFGPDHESLSAWLDKQKDLKEELYTAIDPQRDDVAQVLSVFRDLWRDNPDAVAKYPNLAIAVSVVWDQPQNVYDYRPHQRRTKSDLPEGYLKYGHLDEFRYHVSHAKAIQGKEPFSRLEVLPWEFQVYMVDHRTPVEEREWAIKNYLGKRTMLGKIYHEIEYDQEMLRTQSEVCKLNGHNYTLQDIKTYGGVCAMQADFAARVGKSLDVPAAYVGGQSQDLGLHAWVMWVEVKSASKSSVNFKLESWGRYRGDNYYTGTLRDPQTGVEILDRDMERRLSAAAIDRNGRRQAELAMDFFPEVADANKFDTKKKIQYLRDVLKTSAFNEAAWLELARMAHDGEATGENKTAVLEQAGRLLTVFAQYPDFSWKVVGDLESVQTDKLTRNQFYEKLIIVYETGKRPDLASEARLKWADFVAEEKKYSLAATGLSQTIKKFPDEGRYVPKMMDKLKENCKQFSAGKEYLGKTYLELLKTMNPKRGNEVTKYFLKMSADALAFFKEEKKSKEAAEIERIIRAAGVSSLTP
ncbi:MAG: hypothetical protein J2P46_02530 [Zavarzinella sp.]|nr:hypothetical protein [Zavarzinella sp.]